MSYSESIKELTSAIPTSIVDFSTERTRSSSPTQASSNFITNKEQGDWAENLVFRGINESLDGFVAVRYGKSDDLVAGEEGFNSFYEDFQDELDTIGKRPDLLVFRQADFREDLGLDISRVNHSLVEDYVRLAVAGLEIRSSAFLIDRYEEEMQRRTSDGLANVFRLKDRILNEFSDLLHDPRRNQYRQLLEGLNEQTVSVVSFRRPSWNATDRLSELSELFRQLKEAITTVQKRDYMSITPKVEDLKVVYRWVERFNVPHFYFQVFFDKAFDIGFKEILQLLTDPDKEGEHFEIGKDIKNQNKTTIKVSTRKTVRVAYRIDEPEHRSVRREMGRGRLLFYVTFDKGTAYLDVDNLKSLLGLSTT